MDRQFRVNTLSRSLYLRGTHRVLGNPYLGTFSAFLTLVFLIRISANLYMALDIFARGGNLDILEIAGVHLIVLAAYMVWVGSLSAFRIGFALPGLSFVNFTPLGKRFKSSFICQTAMLKPMNIIWVAVMIFSMIVFGLMNGRWSSILTRILIIFAATAGGVFVVIKTAAWAGLNRQDTQILEVLSLLLLVAINPDIGSYNGKVSLLLRGLDSPFNRLWEICLGMGIIILFALAVLVTLKILSAVGTRFRRRLSIRPVEGWYWRVLRVRFWVVLYVLVIPIFIAPAFSSTVKMWALGLSILFGIVSYLFFISHCENSLQEKWRCSLLTRRNSTLIARSAVIHAVFLMVPVIGFLIGRGRWK